MKKCIIIPDSFKGTMSSLDVCRIMKQSVLKEYPSCDAVEIPVADGGEGTVDCFLHALGGEKINVSVKGPLLSEIDSFYGISGDTAIIEMAAAAGLSLAGQEFDPSAASTYGVGQLAADAISRGCKKIILGLGGSCTNDAGTGMAAALGTKFYDSSGKAFLPNGATLNRISTIETSQTTALLKEVQLQAMCDIDNPIYGTNGAAYVFAPQKGANPEMVALLDDNLRAFAAVIRRSLGLSIDDLKGGGAAGGMGAGVYAILGAELRQGIDVVLDLIHFEELLQDCDYVFTGEGKLDQQSLGGKAVIGISKRAKKMNVPVIAVVGFIEGDLSQIYDLGITKVFSTGTDLTDKADMIELKKRCKTDLAVTMDEIIKRVVCSGL